jgi:membrane protein YqaA with SNARE-associated domain
MIAGHGIAVLVPPAVRSVRRLLFHLSGLGLLPLGLPDSSLLPIPGILDVATIVFSARLEHSWLHSVLMATAGSMAGGFAIDRLARKGNRVCKTFARWGFAAIAIPAILRPPVHRLAFRLAAGAMHYPARKFLAALGRISRSLILAYLASRYGRETIAFIAEDGHRFIVTILLALLATATAVSYFWQGNKDKNARGHLAQASADESGP